MNCTLPLFQVIIIKGPITKSENMSVEKAIISGLAKTN